MLTLRELFVWYWKLVKSTLQKNAFMKHMFFWNRALTYTWPMHILPKSIYHIERLSYSTFSLFTNELGKAWCEQTKRGNFEWGRIVQILTDTCAWNYQTPLGHARNKKMTSTKAGKVSHCFPENYLIGYLTSMTLVDWIGHMLGNQWIIWLW